MSKIQIAIIVTLVVSIVMSCMIMFYTGIKLHELYQEDKVYCVQDCCPLDCKDSETCTGYCCDGTSKHDCQSLCCNGEGK